MNSTDFPQAESLIVMFIDFPQISMLHSNHFQPIGGFHKWGYPNSWLVYNGKSNCGR